jgi:hypothetical protein
MGVKKMTPTHQEFIHGLRCIFCSNVFVTADISQNGESDLKSAKPVSKETQQC